MQETLDVLPGEGETKIVTIKKTRDRRECELCGEPAHCKVTFLLAGARINPASSAYGRDDCSWCSDAETFTCHEHRRGVESDPPAGYEIGSTFFAVAGLAHMFLYWSETMVEKDA